MLQWNLRCYGLTKSEEKPCAEAEASYHAYRDIDHERALANHESMTASTPARTSAKVSYEQNNVSVLTCVLILGTLLTHHICEATASNDQVLRILENLNCRDLQRLLFRIFFCNWTLILYIFIVVRWKVYGKVCARAKWSIRPALTSGFCGMNQLGVFLHPSEWDASPSQGYPQH